jgi:hypothetical protein
MMNDVNISKCTFAGDVVPYMYGEMSAAGADSFETHLLECDGCTDELADVSFARYEVYDWKKLEFDPLPTPRILPFAEPVPVHTTASWFDSVREVFARGWMVPASAFAAFAIAAVYGGATYLSGDVPTIDKVDVTPVTITKPAPQPASESLIPETKTTESPRVNEAKVVKVMMKQTEPKKIQRAPRTTSPQPAALTVARGTKSTAPRLNEFNDDEDTSLRLAMLFDDLDTRD